MTNEEYKQKYVEAIPGCCRLRTLEEHEEIMLCWGLLAQVRDKTEATPCGLCEFNAEPAGDFARIEWEKEQDQQRMWNKLKGVKWDS